MARIGATTLLACGAAALLPAVLGRASDGRDLAWIAVVGTVGCALGAAGLLAARRIPVAVLRLVPVLATVLVCAPTYLTGLPPQGMEPLLIWGVLVAASFGSRAEGWLGGAVAVAAYAPIAVVVDRDPGIGRPLYLAAAAAVTVLIVVSMRQRLLRQLAISRESAVRRDDLTGLCGRRTFEELFVHEAARCERAGNALTLLLIDVDRLADVNDAGGRPAGDQVLRDVAEVLRSQRRDSDVLAHLGEDEFAILLPACGADDAARRAEHIRSLVERTAAGWSRPVTVSVGAACAPAHTPRAASLPAAAQRALAAAKDGGRNRTVVASATRTPPPRRGAGPAAER